MNSPTDDEPDQESIIDSFFAERTARHAFSSPSDDEIDAILPDKTLKNTCNIKT